MVGRLHVLYSYKEYQSYLHAGQYNENHLCAPRDILNNFDKSRAFQHSAKLKALE